MNDASESTGFNRGIIPERIIPNLKASHKLHSLSFSPSDLKKEPVPVTLIIGLRIRSPLLFSLKFDRKTGSK
jgi:hypothetical protein